MEISDARKLKALEEKNRKLKKLLAETVQLQSEASVGEARIIGWILRSVCSNFTEHRPMALRGV